MRAAHQVEQGAVGELEAAAAGARVGHGRQGRAAAQGGRQQVALLHQARHLLSPGGTHQAHHALLCYTKPAPHGTHTACLFVGAVKNATC